MQDENRIVDGDAKESIELERELRAAGLHQRWAAANALATHPAAVAIPIFERLLAEKDIGLRRLATIGLGKHGSEEAFVSLQAILAAGGDPMILAEAANSLFDFGDVAIPILHELFDRSTHWQIRQTVISLLVETDRYEVLLAVATTALTDETKVIRELGILSLKQVLQSPLQASALDLLAKLAEDPDWHIRWCVAIALHNCQEPLAKELLIELQQDENYRVVAAALEGVGIEEREIE